MTSTSDANRIAIEYVKLVLAVGEHDADYVDAFYGPPELKEESENAKLSLPQIAERVKALRGEIGLLPSPSEPLERLRHEYLGRQLSAMAARVRMLDGEKLSFDEESRELYDAVSPHHSADYYESILREIDAILPGDGTTPERVEAFNEHFVIPPAKVDPVFRAAVERCRAITLEHFTLPEGESFTLEYVNNKAWSGYNWYQGGFRSLIQINTDLPIFISRAVDLGCHEGYPGHHVYNSLLEKNLVRDRGWVEFTIYPLFSPQSLIAEGSANYGIDMAFPGKERVAFEREVLFPIAGLDASQADRYYRVLELTQKLSYANNDAARQYLDGEISGDEAVQWMIDYSLMAPDRARQRLKFIEKYRAYVINYNFGLDLVRKYIEGRVSTGQDRWAVFTGLLSSPRLPSGLA
ncbi:MAG: hypothetical protein ACYC7A_01995 [Thermoanaerobaculia bacterium]